MAHHNIHIPYNLQCIHGMIYIMYECFHAHTPSHSPTPSHMPMPSVAIVIGNANDNQIPSLSRLTITQCNLPMGNPSRVNPDSYHSTLSLSDKHDRVFSFGQQNFSAYTAGLLHLHKTFRIIPRVSNTHTKPFRIVPQVSHTHAKPFRIVPQVSHTHVKPFQIVPRVSHTHAKPFG